MMSFGAAHLPLDTDLTAATEPETLSCGIQVIPVRRRTASYARFTIGRHEWILPRYPRKRAMAALAMYMPNSPRGQLLRATLHGLMALRWSGRPFTLCDVHAPELLGVSDDVTGEKNTTLAFQFGNPTRYRKLAVQAATDDGRVLAFFKTALTCDAVSRVRNEADTLRRLETVEGFRNRKPTLLFAGTAADSYICVTSVAPSRPTSPVFGTEHATFLRVLHQVEKSARCTSEILQSVHAQFDTDTMRLAFPDADRWFEQVSSLLPAKAECSLTHGDFCPWNLRQGAGGLFAFDWEAARFDRPSSWDQFHFQVQTASLLGRRLPAIPQEQQPWFCLYLLDSMASLKLENPADQRSIDIRKELLLKYIEAAK